MLHSKNRVIDITPTLFSWHAQEITIPSNSNSIKTGLKTSLNLLKQSNMIPSDESP